MSEHFIEDQCLSTAWGRAIRLVSSRGTTEVIPLIVSITGFDLNGNVQEDPSIRNELENILRNSGKQKIQTVAGTIFPLSLWNPAAPRSQLFSRYKRMIPRLTKTYRLNWRGLYFQRMITGGPPGKENQLEFAISEFQRRPSVRRSALQIGIFDPKKDHSTSARLGFPCMQHITLAPSGNGSLSLNAFYANQYMIEKAYGNYLGLCNLGKFVAKELNLELERVTCFAGIAQKESGIPKARMNPVIDLVNKLSPPEGN